MIAAACLCRINVLLLLFLAISAQAAREDVFQLLADGALEEAKDKISRQKVAIIGAGAGGASAAYFLQRYSNYSYDITVFEKNDYIGGRSTTVNVHDNLDWPVEVGASIFVKANANLMAAAQRFGLTLQSIKGSTGTGNEGSQIESSFGIWDGKDFVFSVKSESSWKSTAKILFQYGLAPIKANRLAKRAVDKFLQMYSMDNFPFNDLTKTSTDLGLVEITSEYARKYLLKNKIAELYVDQILQSLTRVNYAQSISTIHGLEALVCLAAEKAVSVEGGNWKIFENMLTSSLADVRIKSTVTEILPQEGKWTVEFMNEAGIKSAGEFDQVIIAAPFGQSNIKAPDLNISNVPYMTLHVTLLATKKRLSTSYFGITTHDTVPTMILTTIPGKDSSHLPPLFNSINIVRFIADTSEYVYKIFSPTALQPKFLDLIFDGADISWSHEKIWNPYPRLNPIEQFTKWKVHEDGIWYLNGMEQFISTMETSSLAGANVAGLIVGSGNKTVVAVP
ncbi:Prenylcysteine lyase-domain-containing protein [Lipomyces oligophaga]|uniref:Prenylcysteine lyase-domain-containing protein n=1 Tax=Lipomyces oligophaga TaxID=45792 RepID=UPI0034CD6728